MTSPLWSDADLLAHDFNIAGRPDQDPALSKDRPAEGMRLTFNRAYDITPPKGEPGRLERQPYVWCALCQEGGTSDWALRPAIVRNFKYVVCVRHANPPYDPGPGARPEPHGAAFLVGKIADVQFTYRERDRDRFLVTFSEVADVLVPDFWDGSRNPVRYMDVSDIKARGIDFDALHFKPFTPPEVNEEETDEGAAPLTIRRPRRAWPRCSAFRPTRSRSSSRAEPWRQKVAPRWRPWIDYPLRAAPVHTARP